MAKGGLKPPKPRPVKEATLSDINDLLKPEVYERLGPIGTMNMLQTMATAAKIPEVTNVPALIDEPVLPALAGEPAAQKKVQRRVSEAKTGLESPKRREILKAARDVAGATVMPIPTSVKDVLIQQVAKPAMKAIPDASIQAAIAAFLKPKLKPVQLERIGRKGFDLAMGTGEDPIPPPIPASEIANFAKIPVEDVENYLKRTEVDVSGSLHDLSRDFYNYKGYNDEIFDTAPIDDISDFINRDLVPSILYDFEKANPGIDLSRDFHSLPEGTYLDLINMGVDYAFDHLHGGSLGEIEKLIGKEASAPIREALRQKFDDLDDGYISQSIADQLEEMFRSAAKSKKPKISYVSEASPRPDPIYKNMDLYMKLRQAVSNDDLNAWFDYNEGRPIRKELAQWVKENRPELFKKYTE